MKTAERPTGALAAHPKTFRRQLLPSVAAKGRPANEWRAAFSGNPLFHEDRLRFSISFGSAVLLRPLEMPEI